jgi:autotransporter-associated beta strand protein
MKMNNSNPIIGAFLLACVLAAQPSQAQSTDTWVGGTDNTFATAANWSFSSGPGPLASGDSLVFAAVGFTNLNNNETAGATFGSLTFNSGGQAYNLGGNAFTLGTTTPGTVITVNSANAQTISNAIVLAAAAQTIALPAGNLTLRGVISGAGGGLTLSGPGMLTLTNGAAETYTGPTVVNGGTLALYGPNGATSGIYLSSSLTINNGGTVQVNADNSLAGSAGAVGNLPVIINAGGMLTGLSTADTGAGPSSHIRGVLTLNGGTLATGGTGLQAAYGTWDLDDGVVVNGGATASTISALDVVPDQGGGTVFNVANGGTSSGVDLNVTGSFINGSSTHDTGIIKTGAGTMALSGTNTYAGATTISAGTLEIIGTGSLGNGTYAAAITNNGNFIDASSAAQTLTGVISGSGALTQAGSGTLTLSGVNTYSGATIISAGSLTVGGAGQLGGGAYAGNIANAGVLTNNSSASQTWSGVISGGGALTQAGSGTLTLSGVNTYSGATTISGGTLLGLAGGSVSSAVVVTPATGNAASLGVTSAGSGSPWTCPSLTVNPGGAYAGLKFNFTASPSITTAPLNVTGDVTFNATPMVFINGNNVAAGSYPLMVVGGAVPPAVPTLNLRGFAGSATLAWGGSGFSANTLVLTVAGSFSSITGPINWAASGSGTWNVNAVGNAIWKDSSATPQATFYQELAGAVGDAVVLGDKFISANTTVTLNSTVTPASVVVSNSRNNYTLTGTGTIAGTGGLTKSGTAALTISTTNTFTGGVKANGGTLTLDFNASGAPVANILAATNALSLGGGTLNVNGNAGTASSQTFASTAIASGGNVINVVNNGIQPALSLGALTYGTAATLVFSTNGTITTSSAGGGPLGLMWGNYAMYGLVDWASTSLTTGGAGTAPYTIKGLSSVTGGYQTTLGNNFDMQTSYKVTGNSGCTTLRFNTPAATNVNVNGKWFYPNAVLVTPNMGAVNASISGGNWFAVYNQAAGTEWVVQNNMAGYFINTGGLINDRGAAGAALTYVQSGSGTVVMPGVAVAAGGVNPNNYQGQSYLNGGSIVVAVDADLGAPATAAAVNLNGGTVVASNTFAMDNGAGANPRPITLLGNGGGLSAVAGTTLTIDGQVGSAAGTGPLVIGIPASAANGNVAGLLPGSGSIANGQAVDTANPVPVFATGTVALTYPNGANGNYFYGGVIITGGATLSINSQYALGGANYGGLTFNHGTLQYNTTLATGAAGAALDISGAPVTFTNNNTIDINGQTVAYANSIGNSGSGSLTVTNSGVAGVGALELNGGSSYQGGTTVQSGATLGGTGTLAGNVAWTSGSYASLTPGSPMTVSGAVLLTNLSVVVNASGLTAAGSPYTLLTAGGGITGTVNANPIVGVGVMASGNAGAISISGNHILLTVTAVGVTEAWTDGNHGVDDHWSDAANWSGGVVPHLAQDTAFFGIGGTGNPVNLDQAETVGGITFSNASSYTINGANTLTLDNLGHGAALVVTAGTANAINTAVALNDNTTAAVSSGAWLTLGGTVSNDNGTPMLTVNGGGTVVLSAANNFGPAANAVGTTLNGAILQVGNSASLGAGDVNVTANSTLQAGAAGLNLANNLAVAATRTVTVDNHGNGLTLGGVISGNGVLATAGAGSLILSGANNTYAGGTVLNAGTVGISADGAAAGAPGNLGVVPATMTPNNLLFNGGDLLATATLILETNRGLGIGSAASANTATTTAFLDAAAGQTLTIGGVIASAGNGGTNNLTVNSGAGNTGTVVLAGANTFNGTNVISAGVEQLANPLALQNSTLNYSHQGGTLSFGTQTAATLGGLTGTANLTLVNDAAAAVALTLGNNNATTLYTGTLGDNYSGATLTKIGTGTTTIGLGANGGASYTGITTVNEGTLILGGNTALSVSGNLDISGTVGPSSLIMADSATATFNGGMIALCYGANYPAVSTLTVQNRAVLNATTFSFGNGSRVPSSWVTVQDSGTLSISGSFDLDSNIGSTYQTNVVNLNGGTLAVGNFVQTTTGATHGAAINLNGGVLAANASDPGASAFLPAIAGLAVNVLTNGATINPNGYTITVAATLSGAGGLTNIGAGTLILASSNTYRGTTFITNGATLSVSNPSGSGTGTNTVTVGNGGTLTGTGTIAGNVIWQPGALAWFNVGNTPAPLTVGVVTLNNNTVTVNVPGPALTVGRYPLMNYASSTGGFNPTPNFTGSGVANGLISTISVSGGTVILTVAPNVVADVWDVDADGSWTGAANWSSKAVPGAAGDAATLGVGTVLRTVTLDANESLGYLALTNGNSFVIADAGYTLTLDNNYLGAYLTVDAGTSNVIQTALALNDNATIVVNGNSSLAVAGGVANSPAVTRTLTFSGLGRLILANANTYGPGAGSVGTIVNSGTLQMNHDGALGAGDVSLAGNSTLQSGGAGLFVTNNLTVSSGVAATLDDGGNEFTLGGTISSGGTVIKTGSGRLVVTNSNYNLSGGLTVSNGTLVLAGDYSGGIGAVTNNATLQLAAAYAVNASALTLNNNSTLQLRADADTAFTPTSLAVQNAADTLNFEVKPLTSGTGHVLTLNGTLAFGNSSDQNINVTGDGTDTLVLGAITLTSTGHTPFCSLNVNTLPAGPGVVLAAVTTGAWGNDLNLKGGGKVTITGALANTSNGSLDMFVNDGTTVTLQGTSVKSGNSDAFRYAVQNGTLVLDNNSALINKPFGPDNGTSYFILGAATNVFTGTVPNAFAPAAGVLVTNNNNYNAAVYLGDANNPGGLLSVDATVTNYVSDGDVGFTNSGVFTIGGQNTSGINTYANPIILGWTPNRGKSVTLTAATGGEVDFTGSILANGTDTTAGVTVGNAASAGLVKLYGTNTYGGATIIHNGTLALAYNGLSEGSISSSASIWINTGAVLDVTGVGSGAFALGAGAVSQTLQGSGTLTGILTVGSQGTVAPGSALATGQLTVTGNTTLGGHTLMKLNPAGSPTSDELVCASVTAGGVLTVTNVGPALAKDNTFRLFSTGVSGFTAVNLPVADNGYQYTWNNQLAANGTIVVQTAVRLVNTNPATANFTAALTGGVLKFSWAADHQGWQLYTNAVGLNAAGSWFPVPGSAAVTNENIAINPAKPNVFFQLRYP